MRVLTALVLIGIVVFTQVNLAFNIIGLLLLILRLILAPAARNLCVFLCWSFNALLRFPLVVLLIGCVIVQVRLLQELSRKFLGHCLALLHGPALALALISSSTRSHVGIYTK